MKNGKKVLLSSALSFAMIGGMIVNAAPIYANDGSMTQEEFMEALKGSDPIKDTKVTLTAPITIAAGESEVFENVTFDAAGLNGSALTVLGDVTMKNVVINTSDTTKHAVNVWGEGASLTAEDLTIDHQSSGAPIIIGKNTEATLSGAINLTLGADSWYGININDGSVVNMEGAALNVETNGDNDTQSVICVDAVEKDATITLPSNSDLSVVETKTDGGAKAAQVAYVNAEDLAAFITAKTADNADVTAVTLNSDIELTKSLFISEAMKVDGNGYKFVGTEALGKDNVVTVTADDVVLNDVTIVTNAANKSGLHVYKAQGVVANDLTVDNTNTAGGAGVVVNGADLTLNGTTTITLGENSWGAINVDDKNDVSALTFGDGAKAVLNGNTEKSFIYVENATSEKVIEGAEEAGLVTDANGNYIVKAEETPTDPEDPSTTPEEPTTDPEDPSTTPEEPTTDPEKPSTEPTEPSVKPDTEKKEETPTTSAIAVSGLFASMAALSGGIAVVLKKKKEIE